MHLKPLFLLRKLKVSPHSLHQQYFQAYIDEKGNLNGSIRVIDSTTFI